MTSNLPVSTLRRLEHDEPLAIEELPTLPLPETSINAHDLGFIRAGGRSGAGRMESLLAARSTNFESVFVASERRGHKLSSPITLTFEPGLQEANAHLRMPLSALVKDGGLQQILSLELPAPWASGEVSLTPDGDHVHLKVPVDQPGAWLMVPPSFELTLTSGKRVVLEVSSDKLIRDSTPHKRARLQENIESFERLLGQKQSQLEKLRAELANPQAIQISGTEDLPKLKKELDALDEEIEQRKEAIEMRIASSSVNVRWVITKIDAGGPAAGRTPTPLTSADTVALKGILKDRQALREHTKTREGIEGQIDFLQTFKKDAINRRTAALPGLIDGAEASNLAVKAELTELRTKLEHLKPEVAEASTRHARNSLAG